MMDMAQTIGGDLIVNNIDITTFEGTIIGDLIVYEKGGNPLDGYMLYGFDEVGMFDGEFKNPQYCMMEIG